MFTSPLLTRSQIGAAVLFHNNLHRLPLPGHLQRKSQEQEADVPLPSKAGGERPKKKLVSQDTLDSSSLSQTPSVSSEGTLSPGVKGEMQMPCTSTNTSRYALENKSFLMLVVEVELRRINSRKITLAEDIVC